METTPLRSKILDTIIRKSTLKQRVFDNTFAAFNELKEPLLEMASEMDDELDGKLDRRVRLEYRDRGKFEAQLQVANDILIFQMHTDVFEFDANHLIWQNPYVQSDRCGCEECEKLCLHVEIGFKCPLLRNHSRGVCP